MRASRFGFFVQWHINLCRLFNAKAIPQEKQGICPKVNVIARLEYELTYYDSAVYCFNHYTMGTPPESFKKLFSIQIIFKHLYSFKYY